MPTSHTMQHERVVQLMSYGAWCMTSELRHAAWHDMMILVCDVLYPWHTIYCIWCDITCYYLMQCSVIWYGNYIVRYDSDTIRWHHMMCSEHWCFPASLPGILRNLSRAQNHWSIVEDPRTNLVCNGLGGAPLRIASRNLLGLLRESGRCPLVPLLPTTTHTESERGFPSGSSSRNLPVIFWNPYILTPCIGA